MALVCGKTMNRGSSFMDRLFRELRVWFLADGEKMPSRRSRQVRTFRVLFFTILTCSLLFTMWKLVYDGPRIGGIDNLSLFFLLNLNIILLLLMAVLVGRSLVKIYVERHSRAAGSRFQTKLVLSFLGLTLIPSALLFVVASGLITNSIDNWSNLTVERSLRDALDVTDDFYRKTEEAAIETATELAKDVGRQQLLAAANRASLYAQLARRTADFESGSVAVFGRGYGKVLETGGKDGRLMAPENLEPAQVAQISGGRVVQESVNLPSGTFIRVVVAVVDQAGRPEGGVCLLQPVNRALIEKMQRITRTLTEYKQIKHRRMPIKAVYEITLLLVTLVVLFGAIWFGLYLARDITGPIQALMEATQKVSEGDLTVRLKETSQDEVGVLVRSFNRMTEELDFSRKKVEHSHNELRAVNQELDSRKTYIETILANIAAGVVAIDGRGHISTCNPSAVSILHLKGPDPYGQYYEDVFAPEHLEVMRRLMREMGRHDTDFIKQEVPVKVEGVERTLLVHISSLGKATGQFMGTVIVFEDITAIINAEKTSAWRDIAQNIAHEIKNPLTPIRLNAERLRRNYEQDREAFERNFDKSTRIIIQEVEVLRTLVDEFSKFAQLPEAFPEPDSLHEIIDDVVAMYKDLKPAVSIATDFDPSIGLVRLDREQMHRAFRNLVENAMDAVSEKGTIEIRTRRDASGKRILIEIMDDGKGIDPKHLDKIFLPYFSTKKKGTGLGLAIANRIVADHEGHITATSRSPRGTLLAIDLPAA